MQIVFEARGGESLLKTPVSRSLLTVLALVATATLTAGQAEDQAQKAAQSWLGLVDGEKYGASWDEAATLFRDAVTRADWEKTAASVRKPLGGLVSRKLKSSTYAQSLPGAPDGDYVVIQYDTVFANKKAAVETVVPMKDADGTWRVSGYFIK